MADLSLPNTQDLWSVRVNPLVWRITFVSFCFLVFVVLAGTRPFPSDLVGEVGKTGRGSALEALLYLTTTVTCILGALHQLGTRAFHWLTFVLLGLLVYCGLTLLWSDTLTAGVVRLAQFALVAMAVAMMTRALGPQAVLQTTYRILILILVLNVISVALVPGAQHQVGEVGTYPAHISSWRGIHFHKNYAGPVAAMTVLFALAHVMGGRLRHLWVAGAAFVFLLNTNSRASLYVLLFSLALMLLSKVLCNAMGRGAARYALIALLLAALACLPFLSGPYAALMNDPYALTGRVELWHALGSYVATHPWGGSGFGSFWRIGDQSPILHLTEGWAVQTGQGHSGYLDTAVTIGLPGLLFTVLFFVIVPIVLLFKHLTGRSWTFDVVLGILVFAWVHNSVETSLLSGNHPISLTILIGVFGLSALAPDPSDNRANHE